MNVPSLADTSALTDYASQAATQQASSFLSSEIAKNVPAGVRNLVAIGEKVGADAEAGAALGTIVPVLGTAIGGALGAAVGVLDSVGVSTKQFPFFDDNAWDSIGNFGAGLVNTTESAANGFQNPSSTRINELQLAVVRSVAACIVSLGNWGAVWPSLWRQIAIKNAGLLPNGQPTQFYQMLEKATGSLSGVNSPLLANSVARFLGAPQNGAPMTNAINPATGLPYPNGYVPPAAAPAPGSINPKTGLPYPNTGAAPAAPKSWSLSTIDLSGFQVSPWMAGLGGYLGPTPAVPVTVLPLNAVAPGSSSSSQSAHQVVASANAGDPNAANTVLNAVSAARGPGATPAQTQLADTLALAQKIQTHAKYVQKWLGPAAGQQILLGHYLTTANL